MAVRFDPSAAEEAVRAVRFYDQQSPGLGQEFITDVDRVCELVLTFPRMGSPGAAGTRRVLLSKFPISVVYMTKRDTVVVVALAHQRQPPGYWYDRV